MTVCTIARSWFVWMRMREELIYSVTMIYHYRKRDWKNTRFERLFFTNWLTRTDSFKWIMKSTTILHIRYRCCSTREGTHGSKLSGGFSTRVVTRSQAIEERTMDTDGIRPEYGLLRLSKEFFLFFYSWTYSEFDSKVWEKEKAGHAANDHGNRTWVDAARTEPSQYVLHLVSHRGTPAETCFPMLVSDHTS